MSTDAMKRPGRFHFLSGRGPQKESFATRGQSLHRTERDVVWCAALGLKR